MPDNLNPYAPPVATVADIVPGAGADFQPVKIFGTKGRIGRLRYVAYMFAANLILSVCMWIIVAILGVAGAGIAIAAGGGAPVAMGVMGVIWVIYAIVGILNLVFYVRISIQRSHDMNLSGWAVLWTFIPFVVLYWIFARGTQGANRFGPPPPPNSTGVKILWWIGIFFMVFGIILGGIGAGVAAYYQGQLQRAHAMQQGQQQ
jgi:uncharacterized membrane protein YhaH (DUF805 family)